MKENLFFGLTEEQIEAITPLTTAMEIIEFWGEDINKKNGREYFQEKFLKPIIDNNLVIRDLDELEAVRPILKDQSLEDYQNECAVFFIQASTVLAMDAMREYAEGREKRAWYLVSLAENFTGAVMGLINEHQITKLVRSDQGRRNGYKSHAEDYRIIADALKYYQDNICDFESMDDAAEKMQINQETKGNKRGFDFFRDALTGFHKENPQIPKPLQRAKTSKKRKS